MSEWTTRAGRGWLCLLTILAVVCDHFDMAHAVRLHSRRGEETRHPAKILSLTPARNPHHHLNSAKEVAMSLASKTDSQQRKLETANNDGLGERGFAEVFDITIDGTEISLNPEDDLNITCFMKEALGMEGLWLWTPQEGRKRKIKAEILMKKTASEVERVIAEYRPPKHTRTFLGQKEQAVIFVGANGLWKEINWKTSYYTLSLLIPKVGCNGAGLYRCHMIASDLTSDVTHSERVSSRQFKVVTLGEKCAGAKVDLMERNRGIPLRNITTPSQNITTAGHDISTQMHNVTTGHNITTPRENNLRRRDSIPTPENIVKPLTTKTKTESHKITSPVHSNTTTPGFNITTPEVKIECKSGWLGKEEKCYKYFRNMTTWNSAKVACRQEGGHLLTLETKDELLFIQNRFRVQTRGRDRGTWTGLRKHKNKFTWDSGRTDSKPFLDFLTGGGRSAARKSGCLYLRGTKSFLLGNCSRKHGYICETFRSGRPRPESLSGDNITLDVTWTKPGVRTPLGNKTDRPTEERALYEPDNWEREVNRELQLSLKDQSETDDSLDNDRGTGDAMETTRMQDRRKKGPESRGPPHVSADDGAGEEALLNKVITAGPTSPSTGARNKPARSRTTGRKGGRATSN